MPTITQCPSVEELERLAIGVISDEAAGPLEEHLLSCAACVERLAAVEANDTLMSALKSHSTVKNHPLEESGALREIVSRLSELAPATLSTQLDLTGDPRPKKTGAAAPVSYSFLAPAQAPDEIGRLGGYRVLRVLGSGGMGVVFEAEDPKLKRHVALKVMKPELAAHLQSRQRFVREAQAMAALDHDHIVTIYQVGEDAGVPFLAMQFLQGESLADRLNREQGTGHREQGEGSEVGGQGPGNGESASLANALRGVPQAADAAMSEDGLPSPSMPAPDVLGRPSSSKVAPTLRGGDSVSPVATASPSRSAAATLPVDEILRIGGEIADGLAAAHERGLIHRDIKPGNIWLETSRGRPRVKILDFGLARATQGGEELTQSAAVLGTPSYMAPEQARSQPVDARADLFSLGCVLYRMATGRTPFPGNDPLSVLMSLAIVTPPAPRELNAAIRPELDSLIVSLLSKDPAGRPQSAREVAERLSRVQEWSEVGGQRSGILEATSVGNGLRAVPQAADAAMPEDGLPSPSMPAQDGLGRPSSSKVAPTLRGGDSASPWATASASRSAAATLRVAAARRRPPRRPLVLTTVAAAAALLAGMIFYVQTNHGTIRVEINDPEIQVAIKGDDISFKQADNGADVKLSPGEKTLIVERGDFKFETDKLVLKRGDAVTVSVTLLAGELQVKQGDNLIGQGKLPVGLHGWPAEVSLFDGKTFDGWRGDTQTTFRIAQGAIVGGSLNDRVPRNEFLTTEKEYGDFELKLKFKVLGEGANAGVQIRGRRIPDHHEMIGYQADLGDGWWGSLYDESRRNKILAAADKKLVEQTLHRNDWNDYTIRCQGRRIRFWINERQTVDYTEADESIEQRGLIGLQIHGGPPSEAWYKDIRIRELPARGSTKSEANEAPAPAIAPFDAAQAKQHQQAWADYLKLPVEHTNSIGMKFMLIPPGEFTMGSTAAEIEEALNRADSYDQQWQDFIKSEAPRHKVVLTRPVYIGAFEVTQKQYTTVMGKTAGEEITPSHPAAPVDWNDAAEFCAKLSEKENMEPAYFVAGEIATPLSGLGYRLPTEAEWEFSCRAGTNTKFWVGEDSRELIRAAWFDANSGGRFHPVGKLHPNAFGLFDTHGNVWEWVDEWWQLESYQLYSEKRPAVDPTTPLSTDLRVIRGGDWNYPASRCGSGSRRAYPPRGGVVGFRVVLPAESLRGESLAAKPKGASADAAVPAPASARSPDVDPNVELYKWVNDVGGRQHFNVKGVPRTVTSPSEIRELLPDAPRVPVDEPSAWTIDLSACERVTDADLKRFQRVAKPLRLELHGTKITDRGLSELRGLASLYWLFLQDTRITRAGLESLGPLPSICAINLKGTAISDSDLSALAQFPNLDDIEVDKRHLTQRGVALLAQLPKLRDLRAIGIGAAEFRSIGSLKQLTGLWLYESSEVNDQCLESLADLTNLNTIYATGGTAITDKGVERLAIVAPRLGSLHFGGSQLTDAACQHLAAMRNLQYVYFESGTQITASGIASLQAALPKCRVQWSPTLPPPTGDADRDAAVWVLATGGEVHVQFPNGGVREVKQTRDLPDGRWQLTILELRSPWVRDDDFRRLANLPALQSIHVRNRNISGDALAHLRGLPNLQAVWFFDSPVGDAGPALLKENPSIIHITLENTGTTDAELEHIGRHRRLTGLNLNGNRGVTDKGLAQLRTLYALRQLLLAGTEITDAGLRHLSQLKQLASLAVHSTAVTDDGLATLANLKKLKNLNLGYNTITDVGMPEIAKLTGLEFLFLHHTHVGDDGVGKLKSLTKLLELDLSFTELTDEGLKHLHGLANLKKLSVTGTQVTAAGVAALQAALPGCQVEWSDPAGKPATAGQ